MTIALKRHIALQPLSREHHFALLLCWKIRRGLELEVSLDRISKYVVNMYNHQLSQHFDIEENFVFPIVDKEHPGVNRAIYDHRTLKRLILMEEHSSKVLNRIEELLEAHIRFEERTLFPEIQQMASEEQWKIITAAHDHPVSELSWNDQFWV